MKLLAARRHIPLSAALVMLALTVSPAAGQQRRPTAAPPAPEVELPPPYEPQLLRLAEVIGALVWLRDLCGLKDSDVWRGRMAALVATEGTSIQRKERLAGAFNRGYRGYEQTYRRCTPGAGLAMDRFVAEGARLTRELANRFSG